MGMTNSDKTEVRKDSNGNDYLYRARAMKDADQSKTADFHSNLGNLKAYDASTQTGINYTELNVSTDILVYKFDLMVIDATSTLRAYLDPTLEIGELINGKWYCGSTSSTNSAGIKSVDLTTGKWHTMAAEVNYSTKTVDYYVDGVTIVEDVALPSTYTEGTLASNLRIHGTTNGLWDYSGTNNIEVGIDNVQVLANPLSE